MSSARLVSLSIENFALIARAGVTFCDGLTVFSGETGSGKTMLLGALAFALGERATADIVRTGASGAVVTLALDVSEEARRRLDEDGFGCDADEDVILTRELMASGKSSARINGRLAPAATLRALAAETVDFVGQHEQGRLLSPAYQLDVLDRFAGDKALELRAEHGRTHGELTSLRDELLGLRGSERAAADELDEARAFLREIDSAKLMPGEDERLRERRDFAAGAERIALALAQARDALAGEVNGAIDRVGEAYAALGRIERFGPRFAEHAAALLAVENSLTEQAAELGRELERTEFEPGEMESVVERLDRIERLKRRFGGSIESVLAARERLAQTIERFESRDERIAAVELRLAGVQTQLALQGERLSRLRRAAARKLERSVAAELRALAMPSATFAVEMSPLERAGSRGADALEFALSPSAGEQARPLAKAASGGELSRVLLALAVVLADRRERTALIFDEIDAGIGGATALAAGERLALLGRSAQTICVTHLAQVAAWADAHYTLVKREHGGTTTIEVAPLDERRAVESEIARMLSGSGAKVALDHASTLLRDAKLRKRRAIA